DGYEEIPAWIMQGYGTMAQEAIEQLKEYGVDRPTHVFVQAGVYVKDESYRFGLNAFKVLGGSYSMGRYLAQRLDTDISELG
ncbi:hypothetical protein ACTPEF_27325, partial [Clostridioides difficile]